MGKKKNKKKSLTVEPFVADEYTHTQVAQAAREQRLTDLGPCAPEPEPDIHPPDASTSASEPAEEGRVPLKPPETEVPWEDVDTYLTATGAGGHGQKLLVRGGRGTASADHCAHWDGRISAASALQALEVTGTALRTLPAHALGALRELRELRLPNNALFELPDVLFSAGAGLPQLQVIDISSNRLRALPGSIVRLERLLVLNAAANELGDLPDLSCLAVLKTLNVAQNAIAALPAQLPITLSALLAADNQLEELPPALGLCTTLSELDVSSNMLAALPTQLADCVRLKSLRCSGQKAAWIDRKLGKLLQQDGKIKPILNHLRYFRSHHLICFKSSIVLCSTGSVRTSVTNVVLCLRSRGGSRAAARKEAAAAADAIPPKRLCDAFAAGKHLPLKARIRCESLSETVAMADPADWLRLEFSGGSLIYYAYSFS